MNFTEEQITGHAFNVRNKKERIETLEALLATHEVMGAEPDSREVRELKERVGAARRQLMVMCGKEERIPTRANAARHAIGF